MEIKLHDSIDEVSEKDWDLIVGRNRLICRHRYLRAVEKSNINGCRYCYPVVYDGGRILAHTSAYSSTSPLDAVATGFTRSFIEKTRVFWPGFMVIQSFECGTPLACENTFSFAAGARRPEVIEILMKAVEEQACQRKINSVFFKGFSEDEGVFCDILNRKGYSILHNPPGVNLCLRWSNFQDYVTAMRSSYRHKIQNRMARFERQGGSFEILKEFRSLIPQLLELWESYNKHTREFRRFSLTGEYLENLSSQLGDVSSVIVARLNGRIVGFVLLLADDDCLQWLFCGLDYKTNKEYGTYFNLLYRIVRMGVEEHFKEIELGITTVAPKLDLGGEIRPLSSYMKNINPIGNFLMPKAFEAIVLEKTFEQRRVFRT